MNRPRTQHMRMLLPFAWTICTTLALFLVFRERGFDDPFITYRYAQNLASGNGFVYNPGERVLSTTTPLYAIVLAGAHLMGLSIPLVSSAIGCASIAAGGMAFWQLGRRWCTPVAGLAGLLLYPTFPFLIVTLGAETTFTIALILCGFVACAGERYSLAAVLLALATVTRADAAVAAATAGLWVLLVQRRTPWHALGIYLAVLLPWFIFAWAYFGEPLPVTLAAKQRQGALSIGRSFWEGVWPRLRTFWNLPYFPLHAVLALAGLMHVLGWQRKWLLIVGWNLLYTLAYTLLGVTSYFWYYTPLVAGSVALVALGIEGLWRLAARGGRGVATGAVAVALAGVLASQASMVYDMRGTNDNRMAIYREAGEWLRSATPPEASVGVLEVGVIGYYAERRMIDFAGLIQPETIEHLPVDTTTPYEDAALWSIERYHPDYLVLHEGLFPRVEQAAVQAGCAPAMRFEDPAYPFALVVYQCPR